jgi:DNA-binding transcriptional LysR family regulator
MLKSELIATFAQIVESGSLNRAAAKLGLSRSVISDRLAGLEADLGTQLVTRSTHGLSLTPAGERFVDHARRLLDGMEAARNAVAEAGGSLSGPIRLAAPPILLGEWLMPLIASFMGQHPRVHIEVTASDRMADVIQDGLDIAIRSARHPDSALVARKLTIGRRIVVCSPDYRDRRGVPRSLSDLGEHEFVVYRNRRVMQDWTFHTPKGIRSARVEGSFAADDAGVLRHAALAGLGISLMPTFVAAHDLLKGDLVRIDLGIEPDIDAISAVYPAANATLPRLKALVQHLKDGIDDPPAWDRQLAEAGIIAI